MVERLLGSVARTRPWLRFAIAMRTHYGRPATKPLIAETAVGRKRAYVNDFEIRPNGV